MSQGGEPDVGGTSIPAGCATEKPGFADDDIDARATLPELARRVADGIPGGDDVFHQDDGASVNVGPFRRRRRNEAPRPLRTRGTNRVLDRATDWFEQRRHEPALRRRTVLVPGDDLRAQHTAAVVRS
jgi:hypothetical protein